MLLGSFVCCGQQIIAIAIPIFRTYVYIYIQLNREMQKLVKSIFVWDGDDSQSWN